jgi:hypothetical protein
MPCATSGRTHPVVRVLGRAVGVPGRGLVRVASMPRRRVGRGHPCPGGWSGVVVAGTAGRAVRVIGPVCGRWKDTDGRGSCGWAGAATVEAHGWRGGRGWRVLASPMLWRVAGVGRALAARGVVRVVQPVSGRWNHTEVRGSCGWAGVTAVEAHGSRRFVWLRWSGGGGSTRMVGWRDVAWWTGSARAGVTDALGDGLAGHARLPPPVVFVWLGRRTVGGTTRGSGVRVVGPL